MATTTGTTGDAQVPPSQFDFGPFNGTVESNANPLGPLSPNSTLTTFLAGATPILSRVGLGIGGVALMIVGLVIMGASSKAGGEVVSGVVKGVGVATPGGIGKAIGKAAVAA